MAILEEEDYQLTFGDEDIEEIDSNYEAELEYIELSDAYSKITNNITYYSEDQLHSLLDLLNRTLSKG
jgi:hypothetical protein